MEPGGGARRRRRGLLQALVVCAFAVLVAPAGAATRIERLNVTTFAPGVAVGGDRGNWVAIAPSPTGGPQTYFNLRTRQTVTLPSTCGPGTAGGAPSGYPGGLLGSGVVFMNCYSTATTPTTFVSSQLYHLDTGDVEPTAPEPVTPLGMYPPVCNIAWIGKVWTETSCSGGHADFVSVGYSWRDGPLFSGVPGRVGSASDAPDLDSPSLLRAMCAPLRQHDEVYQYTPPLGLSMAMTNEPVIVNGRYVAVEPKLFLDHCGTHHRTLLCKGFGCANPVLLRGGAIWQDQRGAHLYDAYNHHTYDLGAATPGSVPPPQAAIPMAHAVLTTTFADRGPVGTSLVRYPTHVSGPPSGLPAYVGTY